jgi:hypothetical protein
VERATSLQALFVFADAEDRQNDESSRRIRIRIVLHVRCAMFQSASQAMFKLGEFSPIARSRLFFRLLQPPVGVATSRFCVATPLPGDIMRNLTLLGICIEGASTSEIASQP